MRKLTVIIAGGEYNTIFIGEGLVDNRLDRLALLRLSRSVLLLVTIASHNYHRIIQIVRRFSTFEQILFVGCHNN